MGRPSRPRARWERRGQERQQGEAGLTGVGHTQLLIASIGGKRPSPDANGAIAGIEGPFTLDHEEHEI